MMNDLVSHLRSDIKQIHDPQAKAIFETSAEVILALIRTIRDFESRNEQAWEESRLEKRSTC